eukprot:1639529-Pyramimonas_sp.AAC.1
MPTCTFAAMKALTRAPSPARPRAPRLPPGPNRIGHLVAHSGLPSKPMRSPTPVVTNASTPAPTPI